MDIVGYAKAHPWMTGAIVVGGGLVFIVIAGGLGGGGGGGGSVDTGPSDAEVAAQASIAAAQIEAQAIAAQAGAAVQSAQIGAGVQMNSDKLQAEVAMHGLTVQQSVGLASIEADRQKAIEASKTELGIAQAGATAQIKTASKQRDSNIASTIGSIATAAFAFFSDERLKENIVRVGTSEYGYGIYEFNYKGDTKRRRGVIAQEVQKTKPEWVIETSRGLLKVKPQALAR